MADDGKTEAAPILEGLPKGRYLRGAIVTSIACGLGYLATYLGADGSNPDNLFAPANTLYLTILVAYIINWIAFIPAAIHQTEKFFDLTGSITYVSCTIFSLVLGAAPLYDGDVWKFSVRSIIQSIATIVWALRLGSFLFARIKKDTKDKRFDEIKINPPRFFAVWTIQGAWVTLTALAVFVVNAYGRSYDEKELGATDFIGYAIWMLGFAIEVVADKQKGWFAANPANKGKWIDEGLWYYSRHPNYLGEITLWLGQFIAASATYTNSQWGCVMSPLFVCFLLMKVSGVPMLESRGVEKWGSDPQYLLYLKNTSVLLILPKGKATNVETPLVVGDPDRV
ncbi:hypothetical protein TL16_g11567 [Triparma laevis f. inornata]|uniref:Steroid 5-alpha reductase C-terminal domain-containing protein n=1 Tax=Triparma laevis f. inornata TaxID=1714386 RepID=A0A9W7BJS6_9STRA|nr:hypothetical protein TL16_g11567 [Triparma laevis f. inornata]